MMANPVLVFDIETIPDIAGIRRLQGLAPSLSDQEVAQIAFDSRQEKTGSSFLPHYLQRIVAIACVLRRSSREGDAVIHIGSLKSKTGDLADEAALIRQFFDLIDKHIPQLVSWNGSGFDLPVLHYRALIHKVSARCYWDLGDIGGIYSRDFKWNNYINRYHLRHLDLMDLLAMYQPRANAPLDELAKLCGLPGKMGMDGAQVWQFYQDGDLHAIRQYCETDVVNTYLLYCRFQLMRGVFSAAQYAEERRFVQTHLARAEGAQWPDYLAAISSEA
jgi:3'-5' exonuclease